MARKSPFSALVHLRHCDCADCCAARIKIEADAQQRIVREIVRGEQNADIDRARAESRYRVREYAATLKPSPHAIHPLLRPYPCVRNGRQVRLDEDLNVVGTYDL